jgi:hypothetical protein
MVRAMLFVELTPCVAFREEHWTDDDLHSQQSFLLASPENCVWSVLGAESAAERGSSAIGTSPSSTSP